MLQNYSGELAALLTAVFWTITALAFESASRRVGSLTVNLLRMVLAFTFLGILSLIRTGGILPSGASAHNWIWLSVSGLVGFVIGDLMLFRSYVVMSARISMLIMSLAPPIAAIVGYFVLGETLSYTSIAGMVVVFSGIALVVLTRGARKESSDSEGTGNKRERRIKLSYPIKGILLALGGATGQGAGLVLSKYGMQDYDVFASTQIRIITGFIGFALIFTLTRRWSKLIPALKDGKGMARLTLGSVFGPFLGVSFSLIAVRHTSAGIASSLMSIVPVLIIPPAIFLFHEKVTLKEVIGALLTICGVILFFVK